MKITIEINDINELIKLRDWLNAIPVIENNPKFDLTQSISVFEFTIRTENYLRSENIETVSDLIKLSRVALLNIPYIGKRSLGEIIDALSSRGLYLSGECPNK